MHQWPFLCAMNARFTQRPAGFIPMSSEISDLLLFVSYFASQSKGIRFGDYFFDVCCVN